MFTRLMRQRRRIAFSALLAQLAGLVLWPGIVMAATMAIGTIVIATFVILVAPNLRRGLECAAVGLFIAAWFPLESFGPFFVLGGLLAALVLYSGLLDRSPFRVNITSTQQFYLPYDVRDTWARVVPGQGPAGRHYDDTLIDYQQDSDDPDTLYLRYASENELYDERTITFLDVWEFNDVTYVIETDDQIAGEETHVTHKFTETSYKRTDVASQMTLIGIPLRRAFAHWFDDTIGDELETIATVVDSHRSWQIVRLIADAPQTA